MKLTAQTAPLMSSHLAAGCASGPGKYRTIMDSVTAEKVSRIIRSDVIPYSGEKHTDIIHRVSSAFPGTPYLADSLTGGPDTPEALVANFNGVDCFTLIDYVEALARSHDEKSFLHHLVQVRYVEGNVDYLSRRHFFSDWFATTPHNARDVTPDISPDCTVADKHLNRKTDGGEYIPGLGTHPRTLNYIPGKAISPQMLGQLQSGDYVGVYSPLAGLDVSHVGIVIHYDGQIWFRNASSLDANRSVVDSPFLEYMRAKPGIVVLRAE
ncbi:DUF1460 domain-containing protein [Shimwellia blattae]|uniref:Putative lipoprotein n=1 Tax=Shimwellia blattae (strain ATCC 29907 / DSM 4481 / JCM 1650 / NBRC 105725 / CDC 9005-74) TaxID=630626 RepID=I2B9I8_SHIBC|nr:DUF1460 domain-containing protein [Shimwellia blattae]AFJ47192.1 putative lipoprotein [Shimwellia blattae DSM 4481 = NBRC 105725]VDY64680.1 Protein of uncharacterised function (DUF1460) [Shimwellia blattae]VEC22784.1 Protein of uncharacterised function (DUF1460) [Shimwellia blattae]